TWTRSDVTLGAGRGPVEPWRTDGKLAREVTAGRRGPGAGAGRAQAQAAPGQGGRAGRVDPARRQARRAAVPGRCRGDRGAGGDGRRGRRGPETGRRNSRRLQAGAEDPVAPGTHPGPIEEE